jgi:hypothetical protein
MTIKSKHQTINVSVLFLRVHYGTTGDFFLEIFERLTMKLSKSATILVKVKFSLTMITPKIEQKNWLIY